MIATADVNLLQALRRCRERQPVKRGATPYSVVLEDAPFSLRRYHLPDCNPAGQPLLFVYSTINRPDLLDLTEHRSMIRPLLNAGFDIYLLDWGYPLDADSQLDLEDYLDGFLHLAVDHIRSCRKVDAVNAIGICQGGTLLACYAALWPDRIRHLVLLGTPLDFHIDPTTLNRLADALAQPSGITGNIPGQLLSSSFAALRPTDLFIRRYELLPLVARQTETLDEFLCMEAWMYDCPDQPAVMFWRFVTRFYQENALVSGDLTIGGKLVRLDHITASVLNIYAEEDHLIPPAAARSLADFIPSDRYGELACRGGHLGLFLGSMSRNQVIPAIVNKLAG
ncbi:MAG: alpha/beta fold hydrolase [Aquisalimonadaceae bacterium]